VEPLASRLDGGGASASAAHSCTDRTQKRQAASPAGDLVERTGETAVGGDSAKGSSSLCGLSPAVGMMPELSDAPVRRVMTRSRAAASGRARTPPARAPERSARFPGRSGDDRRRPIAGRGAHLACGVHNAGDRTRDGGRGRRRTTAPAGRERSSAAIHAPTDAAVCSRMECSTRIRCAEARVEASTTGT
jgi:hypothetical protein